MIDKNIAEGGHAQTASFPMSWDRPLSRIVNSKASIGKFARLGIHTQGDLLSYAPFRLHHWADLTPFSELMPGQEVTVFAEVLSARMSRRAQGGIMLTVVLSDQSDHYLSTLTCRFFAKSSYALTRHEKDLQPGTRAIFAGTLSGQGAQLYLAHPVYETKAALSLADAQEFATTPVPVYHATKGLPTWVISRTITTLLDTLSPADVPDILSPSLCAKLSLPSYWDALRVLHTPSSDAQWHKAKSRLRWDEAWLTQLALMQNRARSKEVPAPALHTPALQEPSLYRALIESLPYELTQGQKTVLEEIAADVAQTHPMQRLLQGDVGSGKTIVALLSMSLAIDAGFQGVLLVPTEVLARQHEASIRNLLQPLEVALGNDDTHEAEKLVEVLTGSTSKEERERILAKAENGEPMLLIGTHALLQDQVMIAKAGIVIVDEQHRFGVAQRHRLSETPGVAPHVLVMTATPIPRTIAMTVFGDLDVSILRELPQGRADVQTHLVDLRNTAWITRLWLRAREEIDKSGRVFVICPTITSAEDEEGTTEFVDEDVAGEARRLASVDDFVQMLSGLPAMQGIGIGRLHGQMAPKDKAQAMHAFVEGVTPVLVSTTVVEVGIDVPAATMMVIWDADRFGLSQLHQLRGRIGRGEKPGVCMAVAPLLEGTTAYARLKAFESSRDGFVLAQQDLEIRREGDVLGDVQAGSSSSLEHLNLGRTGDIEVIMRAREVAEEVITRDPRLEEWPILREMLARKVGENERLNLMRS
ncbi:MAG: ATP-dependent DNA helicase RecG [Actinomycetaceae bacterium]|nr:ATP-dependent DNA helicase RecG [Actinomycetaceae bacterium]